MSIVKPQKKQVETVGNNIATRREFLRTQKAQTATSAPMKPAVHQPLDKFLTGGKNPANLSTFAPDATFKAAKRRFLSPEHPYKAQRLANIEDGATPIKAIAGRPSDTAILKFLGWVIDKPTAYSKGNPVKKT